MFLKVVHAILTPYAYNPQYTYGYDVNADHPGAVFSKTESRDNQQTDGEYCVNMPDGRVQIVTYTADPSGFHPIIRYVKDSICANGKPAPLPTNPPTTEIPLFEGTKILKAQNYLFLSFTKYFRPWAEQKRQKT